MGRIMSERHDYEASAAVGGAGCMGQVRDQGGAPVVSTGSESPQAPQQQAAQPAGATSGSDQYPSGDGTVIVAPAGPQQPKNQHPWLNIPRDLRNLRQWCVAAEDKRPLTIHGENASSTNPATWSKFDEVVVVARTEGLGIGFVLTPNEDLTVIDFDVKDETTQEQLDGFAMLINGLNSYTELSRSGRGVHVWVRGVVGAGCRKDGVELYDRDRFMICTGNVIKGYPLTIEPRQEALDWMRSRMSANTGHSVPLVEVEPTRTDDAVKTALLAHQKAQRIIALANDNWQSLGYPSRSEAAFALVSYIANSTQSNEQVRRIFRTTLISQSKHGQDYYLNRTLRLVRAEQAARLAALQTLTSLKVV
jgi:primase-polymerase (primpol)-like protein